MARSRRAGPERAAGHGGDLQGSAALPSSRAELTRAAADDSYSRRCAELVQALYAEAACDDAWTVVVQWTQGPFEQGLRIRDLAMFWPSGAGSVQDAAMEIRQTQTQIEEPNGPRGWRDTDGRYWLHGP